MPQDAPDHDLEEPQVSGWRRFSSILPPEFQEALKDNRPPRPGVLQVARALRVDPTSTLPASKARIEQIDKHVKALQEERDRLASEERVVLAVMDACSTICAPARRLPNDILHEIFHYTLPDYPSPSSSDCPMALSHVSSAWRSVALQAPHLWSEIYLRVKSVDHNSIARYAQAVTVWARRSGSLPVDLYLYVDCDIKPGTDLAYNFGLLLKTISPWSCRITRLGIGGQFWLSLITQFPDVDWNLSNLDTLEILGQRAEEHRQVNARMATLQALAPRISMFQTCGPKFDTLVATQEVSSYLPAFSFLPWQKLTSLALDERLSSEHELQKLLMLCPQLEVASLHLEEERGLNMPIDRTPCKLEQLHLYLTPWMIKALPNFFSAFKFDNLTHLRIETMDAEEGDDDEPGVVASFPSLSFLQISPMFSSTYVVKFLRNTPQLKIFDLGLPGSATDFNKLLIAMTANDAEPNFLPLLEEISINLYEPKILLDFSILSSFLCSRTQDRPPNHSALKDFALSGQFTIFGELPVEITRLTSATTSPLQLTLKPNSWLTVSGGLDLPVSYFEEYKGLVEHDDSY